MLWIMFVMKILVKSEVGVTDNQQETIVKRLDNREGYSVIDYREIGLPVFSRQSVLTLQEISQIGPIENFILRTINIGLGAPNQIQEFLGLSIRIINKQIGSLVYDGSISSVNKEGEDEFALTQSGKERLALARSAIVTNENVSIYIDGITRSVIPIEVRDLFSGKQLEDLGISLISPVPRHGPEVSEIKLSDIDQLFAVVAGSRKVTKKVLRIGGFLGRNRVYFQKAIAIAYKSENARKIQIGFAIDGRISNEHEIKFDRAKDGPRSKIFGQLFDAGKRRRNINDIAKHVRDVLPTVDARLGESTKTTVRKIIRFRKADPSEVIETSIPSVVKTLQVYEHPPLLSNAFGVAASRIVIISPWIRAGVVNTSFIGKLTSCLERGVNVRIEYGIGRVDRNEKDSDKSARGHLESLSKTYENFSLIKRGNSHAKVLLVDDKYFVTTSFNWLSFRGDPDQPFREEWGTYVEGAEIVNAYYNTLMQLKK